MKELFTFSKKSEAHKALSAIAKIFKVTGIVLASVSALLFIIYGINEYMIVAGIVLGIVSFFVILFFGWVIEILLLGFANIVENNYEGLVEKGKAEEAVGKGKDNPAFIRLKQLAELRSLGVLTESEYNEKKKETINKI